MTLNLEAIKARCERATNPPWVFNPKSTGGEVQPSLASHAESLGDLAPMPITTGTPFWSDSDFDFIAHARTDLPALVAEVERLQSAIAAAHAALDGEREATRSVRTCIADIVRVVAEMPRAKADESIVRWTERLQAVTIAAGRRAADANGEPK